MSSETGRSFHNTSVPYVLPNDPTEHERLDLQAAAIERMLLGRLCHAPISNPKRILEVGAGTGTITTYLAETYTNAEDVIGLDLSPVPPQKKPSRAKFLQGNFLEMEGQHPDFSPGSFDYMFSRLLVFGMPDWPGYISKAKDVLAPGGWLEIQEGDFDYFDGDGTRIADKWRWYREQASYLKTLGLEAHAGSNLVGHLRDAGFVDVQVKKYRWVFGRWEGHPETDMIGDYSAKYIYPVNSMVYKKGLGPRMTAEQLDADVKEMAESFSFTNEGKHGPFYVVCGRKP